MRRATSLTLALLFLATVLPANSQSAGAEGDAGVERVVVVTAGAPLTVECALRVEERAAWRLDGHAVPHDLAPQGERAGTAGAGAGGVSARLHAAAARPAHRGVYTCGAGPAAQRVRVRVTAPDAATPAPAPAPGAAGADSAAPPAPAPGAGAGPAAGLGAEGDNITLVYELRGPLVLDCTDLVSGGAAQEYKWSVNGTSLESLSAAGRARLVLDASGGRLSAADGRAQDADHGRYECAAGGSARVWAVRQRYYAKLPPYSNVVEEQPLKLACRVVGGTPAAGVAWYYSNDTELAFNRTAMKQLVGGNIVNILDGEHGLRNALLQLKTTVREDAGKYWCVPEDEAGVGEALQGLAAGTVLRVKDKYAALWPFLGICAEVFVLCAVILVYERRRTKPELDDSDTDNHDQKKS